MLKGKGRGPETDQMEVHAMAGMVRPVTDERDGLLTYLGQQRTVLRLAAFGLSDEQARETPTASPLSVGGLIRHASAVEVGWTATIERRRVQQDYEGGFVLGPDQTLDDALDRYAEAAARTEAVVAEIRDLDQAIPVPKDAPWFPDDVVAWSVRWVLLHLIEETARHAGHADILESIDGATAYPLMAAAEGWPATPWVKPWPAPVGRR